MTSVPSFIIIAAVNMSSISILYIITKFVHVWVGVGNKPMSTFKAILIGNLIGFIITGLLLSH